MVVTRVDLRAQVYDWLRSAITYGDLPAGTPLALQGLAEQLDVSHTPVREALALLESTGLVVREARKGYRVAELLTPGDLDLVLDARAVVEAAAARRAAGQMSDAGLEELASFVDAQARSVRELTTAVPEGQVSGITPIREFGEADSRFHAAILRQCGNPFLERVSEHLSGQWHRTRMSVEVGLTDGAQAVEEHTRILEALRARDPEAAEAAMSAHIARIRRDAASSR